ncbi:MAG: hypothetical protein ACYC3Q_08110 [Gemmatimonadaceae bacterium]
MCRPPSSETPEGSPLRYLAAHPGVDRERLALVAAEPKTMRWYPGGHWPPVSEIEYAAEWVAAELKRPGIRVPRAGGR